MYRDTGSEITNDLKSTNKYNQFQVSLIMCNLVILYCFLILCLGGEKPLLAYIDKLYQSINQSINIKVHHTVRR